MNGISLQFVIYVKSFILFANTVTSGEQQLCVHACTVTHTLLTFTEFLKSLNNIINSICRIECYMLYKMWISHQDKKHLIHFFLSWRVRSCTKWDQVVEQTSRMVPLGEEDAGRVMWFNPRWQLSSTQLFPHSPCIGTRERIKRKSEKTHGLR